ncbi:hypothetical protein QJQ45_014257 [Haematococcus lacustris]|nr:hypothetical protein QJQ45_014257 [Haematococcus lacustris]
MTCLKSLGIRHATELQHTIAGSTYIISGKMLKERFHNKVKQKHYIALNRLTTMATQDRCPTTTEAKDIAAKRDTTSDLPAAQRLIKPWAAGLTELAPTDVEEDTKHRYADIRAFVIAKKPTSGTQPPNPTHVTEHATQPPATQEAIKSNSRLLRRENRETQPPPTKPARHKAGTKRNTEGRQIQTIPKDIVRTVGLDLPGLSSWKVDKACRCKPKDLGSILGAMYGHQEAITSIDGWQWDGINKESYYKVHWKPTIIDNWALPLCAEEGYTPTHIEPISREEAKDVCTCELCWLPRGDSPMCHNCKRAYHPACLEEALLSGHKEPGHWLCPICKFGSNEFKTTMRLSAHSDLIRVHWRPTLEPAPLITAHLDYLARRSDYEEENKRIQEARYARPDTELPTHTRQGLPDPHTWLPRCTNLHSKATFHTYPINPQTDIVGTGKCETFLQLHPHMTTPAMNLSTGEPIMPKHDLVQHVHDESGRTIGLITKQQHQHLHAWLQHTPHTRNLATELVALLRRQDTQSSRHPMRLAQDKALATLHTTRSFPSTVQRWADPLTVRPETTTYWSPDINDTAFGAHHNCLLVRHTGLSTWNVPADDAVALKCVNHAIHSAHQEEAMATIMLIPGKKGISHPKHIDTLRRYPEYCQHLASIPLTNTNCSKLGKHATLLVYVIWNEAGQLLTTKGNPQGWMASTATALHPDRETHPLLRRPHNQKQPATLPSGHKQHLRLPLDRALPTLGHTRSQHQLTHHSTTLPRMAITEWTTVAYTDGSCIKTSEPDPARVGAGVYIPESNALLTIAMNDLENNTINKAELTVIHAALKAGARRIATDSLCSLYQIRRALANPMSLIKHRHNDILTDIATLIIDSPDTIQFYKVRAHSGIIGNEGADALAKHAALHPEQANTLGYHPTIPKERGIWLNHGTDSETLAPLPDCRQSVRAHMHSKHKLGLANQDSIYYQMTQDITKAAAKGAGERVMTDATISTPAQRTALLYRTGGLYNQKLAMRWKQTTDDRCPLCGEADSATHLLSGCSETLPLVQERHNGAGRLIAKAISKGTLGGCIRFADTGSWEKGARENLDLPNDTLHTTLRALGLKPTATKNTTRPDILMVAPQKKTGKRGKAIKRITIVEIKYCADSRQQKRRLQEGEDVGAGTPLGSGSGGSEQQPAAGSDPDHDADSDDALKPSEPKRLRHHRYTLSGHGPKPSGLRRLSKLRLLAELRLQYKRSLYIALKKKHWSTPFLVNYGQSPITPVLHKLPRPCLSPSAESFAKKWEHEVKHAQECMRVAQDRQQRYANKRRRDVTFSLGDSVMLSTKNLRNAPGKARKFLPRYVGPFKVTGKLGEAAYRLELPPTMSRLHPVFHVSLLKKYTGSQGFHPPPVMEWLEDAPHYEHSGKLVTAFLRFGASDLVHSQMKALTSDICTDASLDICTAVDTNEICTDASLDICTAVNTNDICTDSSLDICTAFDTNDICTDASLDICTAVDTLDICTDASLDICTAADTVDICTAKHPSTSAQLST